MSETTNMKQPVDLRELKENRARKLDEARGLLNKCDATSYDRERAKALTEEAAELRNEIDKGELHNEAIRDAAFRKLGGGASHTARFRNVETGAEVRAVKHNESFRTAIGAPEPTMSVGQLIYAVASGDWGNVPEAERRNYQQSASASGGYLLNPQMSATVIDLARANSVISAAGAITVPMETEELKIARVKTDPLAYWTTENMAITESEGTFDMITLRSHCLAVYCTASIELIRNSANAQSIIENTVAKAIALKFDESALNGRGAAQEPWGLLYSSQVGTYSVSGAISHDKLLKSCRQLWNANVEPTAMIYNANCRCAIASLKDGDGQYAVAPPEIARLSAHMSTQVSSTDSDNCMYVGDFSNCIIGLRSQVEIEISPYAGDAYQKKQIAIRGLLFGDFFACRNNDIVRLTAISGTTD